MTIALVAVNSPAAGKRAFSYIIPSQIDIVVGQAVWVPFGTRILQGIIIEIEHQPSLPTEKLKKISGIIDLPALSPARIATARYLAEYYMAPYFHTFSCFFPPSFSLPSKDYYQVNDPDHIPASELEEKVFRYIQTNRPTRLMLRQSFDNTYVPILNKLIRQLKVVKTQCLASPRVNAKTQTRYCLNMSSKEASELIKSLRPNAYRRKELLQILSDHPIGQEEAARYRTILKWLVGQNIVRQEIMRVWRDIPIPEIADIHPPLNPNQKAAIQQIKQSLVKGKGKYLLHGSNSDDKTEVYLACCQEVLSYGQNVVVLLPEISMCTPLVARLNARFPGQVAVLHSQLSLGQRLDQWKQIECGNLPIVVGTRGAIFAPVPQLGLLIIDEEHDPSYKQTDRPPFYHARTVGLKLCQESSATLLLGSATPSLESYAATQKGILNLLHLPTPAAVVPVQTIDMRQELKTHKRAMISKRMEEEIRWALSQGQQVYIIHNRRGYAHFRSCPNCSYTPNCSECQIPLVQHQDFMLCHRCGQKQKISEKCPSCDHILKSYGFGTESIMVGIAKLFPLARLLRWDSDIAAEMGNHQLREKVKESDIVIGTQMLIRDINPNRALLSALVLAESGDGLPDFRTYERIFQLAWQTASLAYKRKSRIILQSYNPQSYPIMAAAARNYDTFFREEMAFRQKAYLPPYCHFATITISHTKLTFSRASAQKAKQAASEAALRLKDYAAQITATSSFARRKNGRFYNVVVIKSQNPQKIINEANLRELNIDIDHYGVV